MRDRRGAQRPEPAEAPVASPSSGSCAKRREELRVVVVEPEHEADVLDAGLARGADARSRRRAAARRRPARARPSPAIVAVSTPPRQPPRRVAGVARGEAERVRAARPELGRDHRRDPTRAAGRTRAARSELRRVAEQSLSRSCGRRALATANGPSSGRTRESPRRFVRAGRRPARRDARSRATQPPPTGNDQRVERPGAAEQGRLVPLDASAPRACSTPLTRRRPRAGRRDGRDGGREVPRVRTSTRPSASTSSASASRSSSAGGRRSRSSRAAT